MFLYHINIYKGRKLCMYVCVYVRVEVYVAVCVYYVCL